MKEYKAFVVGDFAHGEKVYSGQTAKVRDYHAFLAKRYGDDQVLTLDTRNWKKHIFSCVRALISGCKKSENVVLLLCANGLSVKTVFPLVMRRKKKYGFRVLFSIVGGALMTEFEKSKYLQKNLPKTEAVYVETRALENMLKEHGLTNVYYAPVFSRRKTVTAEEIPASWTEPLRLCTYARVVKEKGISDAIDAVVEVNRRLGRKACILDVYGPAVPEYKEEFDQKVKEADGSVENLGLLTDENAIDELSKHYLLVFPTYYVGEGFPIALLESMKSALPVVATDWHFNSEIIDSGKTGIVYNREKENLADILERLIQSPETVTEMRLHCLEKAATFDPEAIMQNVYQFIDAK